MIAPDIREAILALHRKGTPVRKIARLLKISRNSVRRAIRRPSPPTGEEEAAIPPQLLAPLKETFVRCEGNVIRVREILAAEHEISIAYSTLTRWVREADLRAPRQRAGRYHFGMGEDGVGWKHGGWARTLGVRRSRPRVRGGGWRYRSSEPRTVRTPAKPFAFSANGG